MEAMESSLSARARDDQQRRTSEIIPIDAILIILTVLTLAGNTLTMCAIIKTKKLSAMISNQFIFSLALSDWMVGLNVPIHLAFNFVGKKLGKNKCMCILRFVLVCLACSSSICNLLATAIDRYVAIVHPLRYSRFMTRRAALLLIAGSWSLSLTLATMPIYWNDFEGNGCLLQVLPPDYVRFVLTPMFAMTWMAMLMVYWRIWREAADHTKRMQTSTYQSGQGVNDSKSLQVVLLIMGCFTACWLPYFVVVTVFRLCKSFNDIAYEVVFTLAVANSGMNPIIYAWKNTNFREAFWCLLRCKSPNALCHKNSFITNHVPGIKKNAIFNGECNGTDEDLTRSEVEIEMQCSKIRQYENKYKCSKNSVAASESGILSKQCD